MHPLDMPVLLIVLVLILAGCAPGDSGSDGIPSVDEPFTLTAFDVGHPMFPIRCMGPPPLPRSQHGTVLPCAEGAIPRA